MIFPGWVIASFSCLRLQRAVKVGSRGTAVDEKVGSGDESAAVAHQQFGHIGYFISRSWASGWTFSEHILIEITARTVEFVERQRRDDDTWRDGVDACAACTPSDGLSHDALHVAALVHLVGVQRVLDVFRLQHIEGEQFVRRSNSQQFVFLRRKGRYAVARLAGDGYACTARSDDLAHLFE